MRKAFSQRPHLLHLLLFSHLAIATRLPAQLMRGPIAELFDERQLVRDVSGAGNNWAHGYCGMYAVGCPALW